MAGAAALGSGALWAQPAGQKLRIGFQKSASLLTLQKSQGTLEKRLAPLGFGVQWVEFPAGPQLLEGLNVGSLRHRSPSRSPTAGRFRPDRPSPPKSTPLRSV